MRLSLLLVLASAAVAAADPPSGYQCQPGTPKKGVGCVCPAGHVERRTDDDIATCAYVPKPSETTIIKAECKAAVAGVQRAYGTSLAGDEKKQFATAFGELVLRRCSDNPWAQVARKCFTAAATEEASHECIEKLPPVERGGLEADSARVHPIAIAATKTELKLKGTIVFARTLARPSARSQPLLDLIAKTLHQHPTLEIEIQVHSDNTDEDRKLTQQRADAIKTQLVARGVAAKRIAAKGYGDALQAASNSTAWGRSRNRRIELAVTKGTPRLAPSRDRDRDFIDDDVDKCVDQPETWDGHDDEDGCPEAIDVTTSRVSITQTISFGEKAVVLDAVAKAELDQIAVILERVTEDVKIVGHTDSTEDKALGLARAKAVRDYLITKKIAAGRLAIEGAGPTAPISSNRTPDGRAANRRVEFQLQ